MTMTPDEIAAERERFAEACPEFPQTKMAVFGDPQFMFSHTRVAERAWMKRAEIARAEQAELRALLAEVYRQAGNGAAPEKRHVLTPALRDAIRDIVYPNNEWRARMGGVG